MPRTTGAKDLGPRQLRTGAKQDLRSVRIDADRWQHALQQPEGASEYIRRLIDADKEQASGRKTVKG